MTTATDPLASTIYEIKGQRTWLDYGLPDLRTLPRDMRILATEEIMPAASYEAAIAIVALHLGFTAADACVLKVDSPIGEVLIERQNLGHIVEKRQDARERYVMMAMDTLTGPFEIWRVAFSDHRYRLAFIGSYESRRQMLVSVALVNGRTLWNFMHTDAKSLNKHRHGELLYKRYELL